jgi:hypothetical protein
MKKDIKIKKFEKKNKTKFEIYVSNEYVDQFIKDVVKQAIVDVVIDRRGNPVKIWRDF